MQQGGEEEVRAVGLELISSVAPRRPYLSKVVAVLLTLGLSFESLELTGPFH